MTRYGTTKKSQREGERREAARLARLKPLPPRPDPSKLDTNRPDAGGAPPGGPADASY